MAQTLYGYQGSVSESQWAELISTATQKYVRDSFALPTMLPSTTAPTSLRFAPFKSLGAGMMVKEDANVTVATPSGAIVGRWYLLVLRRVWGLSPSAQHVWIATTSTAATPPAFPAGRQVIPGVTDDEPVGWYKHQAGASEATWISLSSLAGGVVSDKPALWDGREQGFTFARSQRGADVTSQWQLGDSEFYAWNPGLNRWEARGNDTITIYAEWTNIVSNSVTQTLTKGIAGIFEVPPVVIPMTNSGAPNVVSLSSDANATTATVYFWRSNASQTTVRALIVGIPKRS